MFKKLRDGIGVVAVMLLFGSIILFLIALAITIIVGAWDLVVWLTRANWRTTEFGVPMISGIACALLLFLNRVILIPLLDWAEGKIDNSN